MLNHREQIPFDSILLHVNANNSKQVFEFLAEKAGSVSGLYTQPVLKKLINSEKLSPSGIGQGVALPHLKMRGIRHPVSILMTLSSPVSFDGIDETPVDIVCLLISPAQDGIHHLRRLSRFSRLLRNQEFCDRIRKSSNKDELQDMFLDSQRQLLIAA